ncbi:hypothetical protein PHMEG_0006989 [Phytophthora megakarya]|uniref:Integrase zinc-binding domain-containing protein n=1 Tax=Phytophthora megakarya TaxID=4795 RepID=A0A225WMI4_9STRA|nr:hypothetical protein PHMEG_0006989 [Phytophthora megakarya]
MCILDSLHLDAASSGEGLRVYSIAPANDLDLDDSLALIAPPTKCSPSTRLDPSLLYAQLPRDYEVFVVSFDSSAKTEKNGGYGSCSWIVWKLPEWQIVIAASACLEQTTVNMAEYSGMNDGVIAALEHGAEDLVIVGDSRLSSKSFRYLHVVCEYNAAADSLASKALGSKVSTVVLNDHCKTELKKLNRIQEMIYETPNAEGTEAANEDPETQVQRPRDEVRYKPAVDDIDPVAVQEERRRRIALAQDEELRWSNLKRLVVPIIMIQEVLHNCHESIEGGRQGVVRSYQRVKHDYYWIGLYANMEKHVKSCIDCSSSKSLPQLKDYSPGNVLVERPFPVVPMDFVIRSAEIASGEHFPDVMAVLVHRVRDR